MKKKLIIFIMTFIFAFSVISIDYIDARATEFIPEPPVYATVGTGLLSLMAISGVLPEVAMLGAFTTVSALGAYTVTLFTSYCAQKADIDTTVIDEWLEGVRQGVIDTSSTAYELYKEWLTDLVTAPLEASGNFKYTLNGVDSTYYLSEYLYISNYINAPMDFYVFITSPTNTITDSNNRMYIVTTKDINTCNMRGLYDDKTKGSYSIFYDTIDKKYVLDGNSYYVNKQYVSYNNYRYGWAFSSNNYATTGSYSQLKCRQFWESVMIQADTFEEGIQKVLNPQTADWSNLGGLIGDSIPVPDLSDLPLSGSDSISMNLENVFEKLGDIENVLERVLEGDITIDNYRDAVCIYPVSDDNVITTDKDVPISDYAPNPDYAPSIPDPNDKPVYNDSDFTVQGLKEIFPFCIPFDFIDFIKALRSEPKAPKWVLSASFLGKRFEQYTITIDLSSYDSLAVLCRKTELLLFIIALILITRNIIKG